MTLSVFGMFKIGVGPSSSHTTGPMVAAGRFLAELDDPAHSTAAKIRCSLHGSLAFTGKGHGTDRAIMLGLSGVRPEDADPDEFDAIIERVAHDREVRSGATTFQFDPARDLVFDRERRFPGHSNAVLFQAFNANDEPVFRRVYYSIGGGFVCSEDEMESVPIRGDPHLPFPFQTGAQLLEMAARSGLSIGEMVRANELTRMNASQLDAGLDRLWETMDRCVERGLNSDGILPGGLGVRRRAAEIFKSTTAQEDGRLPALFAGGRHLTAYAMAVNEENASGAKVVTAPTNGAAGVIPAVCRYYLEFGHGTREGVHDFLLTAAAIGIIIKQNASISGAEVGCQGEVGSAAAMAAAGLCAQLGGSPRQVENAAEMALEHHLGMTCDPVGGLVQIPCIERNAFGAVKATTAAMLALQGGGDHVVSLDACVETMRQTGHDMGEQYKETSLAGLAVNVPSC